MTDPNRPTVEPLQRQDTRNLEKLGRKAVEKNISTLKTLKVDYVSPETIYPNAYNPNRQTERDFELLLSSMTEDGFTQPILVHRATREIVDGEHRWRAAQRLGLKEIPVVFVDMTMEQMRISTLRHNRARGSEDIELTIEILKDLRALGALEHAVDSLGMSEKELSALIEDLPAPEAQASSEFSAAWLPAVEITPTVAEVDAKKRTITSASESRNRMQKIIDLKSDTANSELERQNILREDMTGRTITAVFNPEQAALVVEVLGPNPAAKLLQLARFYLDSNGIARWQLDEKWNTTVKL